MRSSFGNTNQLCRCERSEAISPDNGGDGHGLNGPRNDNDELVIFIRSFAPHGAYNDCSGSKLNADYLNAKAQIRSTKVWASAGAQSESPLM